MSERVEEIRIRVHHLVHGAGPDPLPGTLVCEPCRRVTTALAQAERERRGCEGALADAATVPTDDVEAGIRALIHERNQTEREREIADERRGIMAKMLRYIAFVAAGDENADSQLAVDRLKAEVERLHVEMDSYATQNELQHERIHELNVEVERLEQQIIETSIRRAVAPAAEQADRRWADQSYVEENAELRAEVERLKASVTNAEIGRQNDYELWQKAEADLARVRAALDELRDVVDEFGYVLFPSMAGDVGLGPLGDRDQITDWWVGRIESAQHLADAALEGRG